MAKTDLADIIKELHTSASKKDCDLIECAYNFAQKAHLGQFRKSGEPYFLHVYATAKILAEFGMTPTMIAAGFLHDVIEDTPVTATELEHAFGKDITTLV